MSRIRSYRDLDVWQRAVSLAVEIYEVTRSFPTEERFGLAQQLRKTAVSIPSNVAEGFNRQARAAYINHLTIGRGSQRELDTQLEVASRVNLIPREACSGLFRETDAIGQMLSGLIRSLERTG